MSVIYGIDIGSNSVRLARMENGVTQYKHAVTTRLAEGMEIDGSLQDAPMRATVLAVCEFVEKARDGGCEPFIFATAAVRVAKNGREFAAMVKERCGVDVDIISGGLEAKLGYIGAGGLDRGGCTVIDIGGASTEVVSGVGSEISYQNSFPIGVVLLKGCLRDRHKLDGIIEDILPGLSEIPSGKVYAVGGTATTLAAMELKLKQYNPLAVNGYCMDSAKLKQTAEHLLATPPEVIRGYPGIMPMRADVIAEGAYLLYNVLKKLKVKRCYVSDRDNLEGYAAVKYLNMTDCTK